jgi:excisionase family DNA binding protein
MDIGQAAEYLHIAKRDVEMLVRRKEIPFEQQGERCVFRKAEIEAWASQRILGLRDRGLAAYHGVSSEGERKRTDRDAIMPGMLRPDVIEPGLKSKTRASVLRDVVAAADRSGLVSDPRDLLQSLEEREKLCSTGLPGGLALLHARRHEPYMFVESFIMFCRTLQPIPFGAPDGKATDLFFLVCCQDDRCHLHALARLCMMADGTEMLLQVRQAPAEVHVLYDCIVAAEKAVISRR